jgi:hypothetical protein
MGSGLTFSTEPDLAGGFTDVSAFVRDLEQEATTPLPKGFCDETCTWVSATPFAPPSARHRFRKNGRVGPGETPEHVATHLLRAIGMPQPVEVTVES